MVIDDSGDLGDVSLSGWLEDMEELASKSYLDSYIIHTSNQAYYSP